MKTFRVGDLVEVKTSPSSPFWHEATYLGLYTIHYGHRPWHLVRINADRHIVPINRIRKLGLGRSAP